MTDIIYAFRATTTTSKAVKEIKVWNDIIGAKFAYLVTTQLIPFLIDVAGEFFSAVAEELAGRIVCNLDYWDKMIIDCTAAVATGANVTCLNIDLDKWDSEFSLDPDTYGMSANIGSTKRSLSVLDKRDGSPRSFTIDCGIDTATGLRRIMIVESVAYPNGGDGDNLEQANRLTVRFALANQGVCTDVSIDPNAPNNIWVWVTEHILELQLIPRAIEFMVTGVLPAVQGLSAYETRNELMSWDVAQLLNEDYSKWASGRTDATGIPMERIFNALGSKTIPGPLRNTETHLNSLKGRVFAGKQPIGDDAWNQFNAPDVSSIAAAVHELRMVASIFEYLNGQDVNRQLINTYSTVRKEFNTFQSAVDKVYGKRNFDAGILWRNFMENFMQRISSWVGTWVTARIRELTTLWEQIRNAAPDQATRDTAEFWLAELGLLKERIDQCIRFDQSVSIYM
ncbi:hypothetical protein PoHVEF18_010563 [Penicillium ochrochloron]